MSVRLFFACNRTTEVVVRGRFIQTQTEQSIAIQHIIGYEYDGTAMDDTGSKELVA